MSETKPFRRELTEATETRAIAETQFEMPRGINKVEVRPGYLTAHVTGLSPDNLAQERVAVLQQLKSAQISIDFLKLTDRGLSFCAVQSAEADLRAALDQTGYPTTIKSGRCIVLAHAANMRDEEGLIARIISEVVGTGVEIDHLGDMHDRVLLVMDSSDAEKVAARITERLVER